MKLSLFALICILGLGTALWAQNSSSTKQRTNTSKTTAASKSNAAKPAAGTHPNAAKSPPARPWVTTGSGLKYQDIVVGNGAQPKPGDDILVNYTGRFLNGKVFDSSLSPGRTPFELHLGRGEVIPGWDQGLATMHVGGKRKLIIPPSLAYGAAGAGGVIPPNATLMFDVELLKIK
jgi:FKBP-type peptidyl-prolyl cis-trans isomerase FkpA